jgi:hypothetical protein
MALRITDDTMTLEVGDRVVATARFSEHAAADGNGAWIVSTHPAQLFTCNQAITALTVAEFGRERELEQSSARGYALSGVAMTDRLSLGSRRRWLSWQSQASPRPSLTNLSPPTTSL